MHHHSENREVRAWCRGQSALDGRARLYGDAGSAIVEAALILPFLAIMVFGTVDLARAFALKNRLTNMAREGAVYGQLNDGRVNCTTGNSIQSTALAEDAGLSTATVTVTNMTTNAPMTGCADVGPVPGTRIKVNVSKSMTILTPIVSAWTGNPVTINGYIEMVAQGSQTS